MASELGRREALRPAPRARAVAAPERQFPATRSDHKGRAAPVARAALSTGRSCRPALATSRRATPGPHAHVQSRQTGRSTRSVYQTRPAKERAPFWQSWVQPRRQRALRSQDALADRRGLMCSPAAPRRCWRRSRRRNPQLGTLVQLLNAQSSSRSATSSTQPRWEAADWSSRRPTFGQHRRVVIFALSLLPG